MYGCTHATGMVYLVSVSLEYVRSLGGAGLPVPDFLHQLIVNALLSTGSFFHLHQLLLHHLLPDSKPLVSAASPTACQQAAGECNKGCCIFQ